MKTYHDLELENERLVDIINRLNPHTQQSVITQLQLKNKKLEDHLDNVLKDLKFLRALERHGVDNWEGYGDAIDTYQKWLDD